MVRWYGSSGCYLVRRFGESASRGDDGLDIITNGVLGGRRPLVRPKPATGAEFYGLTKKLHGGMGMMVGRASVHAMTQD